MSVMEGLFQKSRQRMTSFSVIATNLNVLPPRVHANLVYGQILAHSDHPYPQSQMMVVAILLTFLPIPVLGAESIILSKL